MNTGKIALWALNLSIVALATWLYMERFQPETVSAWDQAYIHFMDDVFGSEGE